jgi:hypothetical protein
MPSSVKALQEELKEAQSTMDEVLDVLEDAFTVGASRADLADAMEEAIDLLSPEDDTESEESSENDDDD